MNQQTVIGLVVGAVAVTALATFAGYQATQPTSMVAKAVSSTHEECSDQIVSRQKPVRDPNQITGTVAGAVVGGLLGSKVGGGDGKKLATVGGAVAGGYAGNKVQESIQERNVEQSVVTTCRTVND